MSSNRQFAIGDIHGCLKTFQTLLYQKIQLRADDQVFLLGDYVDHGPDSFGVLDEIIQLQARGYAIHPIMGNHELMFLANEPVVSDRHRRFIEGLPYFLETNHFFFVHAGLNFQLEDPLEGRIYMIWGAGDSIEPDLEFLQHRKVVHGHRIHSLGKISDAIVNDDPIIPLDNGCYKGGGGKSSEIGNLCALDLGEMKLLVQENVDR